MAEMSLDKVKEFVDQINPMIDGAGWELALVEKGEKMSSEEIDGREEALLQKERAHKEELEKFLQTKADIEAREIALESQEKAFDAIKEKLMAASAELAQKKADLFKEAEKLASGLYQDRLTAVESEAKKIIESAQASSEKTRAEAEMGAKKIREEAYAAADQIRKEAGAEKDRILKQADDDARKKMEAAESDTASLKKQIEQLIAEKAELSGKNTELRSQNEALVQDNAALLSEKNSQRDEFNRTAANYKSTMDSYKILNDLLNLHNKDAKVFIEEIDGLNARVQELNNREDDLNRRSQKLSFEEHRNARKAESLDEREGSIEDEVETRWQRLCADKDAEIESLQKQAQTLREALAAKSSIVASFDDLKAELGGKNPAEVLLDYQRVQQELELAVQKVSETPSYVLRKTAEELKEREDLLKDRENQLEQEKRDFANRHDDYARLQTKCEDLSQQVEDAERDKKIVVEQLQRLRSTYENPAERKDRIAEINKAFAGEMQRQDNAAESEIAWLDCINTKIEDSGLHFPRRILDAFHTALKTSEMSPLTVLAGVSGTGKSELPRLYSRFGGINFLSVPVQPNWDCQEAMLGYYNSIDNCFEPTDMLRLLAQSQRKPEDQNGLNDCMTMILLDEMNLANVELYFADFLSKLETRRGLAENDPNFPYIGVKIGSKMENFPLRLGRNVLWTGTMNNDETTKTLSDKVIDRGIVINFPRPKTLIRSRTGSHLAEPAALLPKAVWNLWVDGAYKFDEKQILEYKDKVEKINEQLGKGGRALGHRVWQSIENYMSLYPGVIAAQSDYERKLAMERAFEDQLVQKVMPKLRGLETRGTQKEVLDSIKLVLPETLHADFDNAVNQNYGQFIWTTSGYLLREDGSKDDKASDSSDVGETSREDLAQKKSVDSIVEECVALINKGELTRDKVQIKNFLDERGTYSLDRLKLILAKTKK